MYIVCQNASLQRTVILKQCSVITTWHRCGRIFYDYLPVKKVSNWSIMREVVTHLKVCFLTCGVISGVGARTDNYRSDRQLVRWSRRTGTVA